VACGSNKGKTTSRGYTELEHWETNEILKADYQISSDGQYQLWMTML